MTFERVATNFRRGAVVAALFALGGCSFASDALFPSFNADTPESAAAAPPPADATMGAPAPAPVAAAPITAPPSNGRGYNGTTVVGLRVTQFRGEYEQVKSNAAARSSQFTNIRAQTVANAGAYNAAVGVIRSRLQIGTTPGNPELLAQWQEAQARLTASDSDLANMNQLSSQVAADAGSVAYLLDSVRSAFTLSGAVDEDHRQLRMLEDEIAQTNITIDRLLQSLNTDIARQQQFVTNERNSLVELAAGINVGGMYQSGMARSASAASPGRTAPVPSAANFADRKPLVVIRFDKADVAYEPALYQALSRALERRPDAVFDLVAVSSSSAGSAAARRNAEGVMRSMTNMGLPPDRVVMATMSSASATSPEVHVYVR
ncbi:MAG: hypothetical protein JNM81_00590 [Rhodospirillaceae bacterium]|nr:hypothetical protein [Rhodospirillaceae bacterium]